MKPEQRPCHPAVIAEDTVGSVSICPGCGAVHMTLQHVTLRFAPDTFRVVANMLGVAQERINGISRKPPLPAGTDSQTPADRHHDLVLH